ncbi:hypothetical protein [Phyllobacterium phragmitis]|uniref:hypothetical protein n=1 Tax=Phyllobacterium phragmitis TaxID=2670329 RepID=UPI001304FCC4|nr:hypothetical protein [Phyllobacterium phragmitis]
MLGVSALVQVLLPTDSTIATCGYQNRQNEQIKNLGPGHLLSTTGIFDASALILVFGPKYNHPTKGDDNEWQDHKGK